MTRQIPLHVLSGYLGSGKTTLLNQLIGIRELANTAVIINEFGEIGLDHHLVQSADDTIIELSNGCLCCTVRGQLVETLEELVARQPDRIIIETTGLADPGPVLQAVMATPSIRGEVQFAGLFTVFDAISGSEMIADRREARLQLQLADHVILTKLDAANEPDKTRSAAEAFVYQFNSDCRISSRDEFLTGALEYLSQPFSRPMPEMPASDHHSHDHNHQHDHDHHHHDVTIHDERIAALTLVHAEPISRQNLMMFLDLLLSAHGDHVLRLKGLANLEDEDRPAVIQAVGRTLSEINFLPDWPDGDRRTRLVVFVDGIDREFVRKLFEGFMNIPSTDTPDRQAIAGNPLAIPGMAKPDFRQD